MQVSPNQIDSGSLFAGRYLIKSVLGSGGMGKVYLACDTMLADELVALKVLHADLSTNENLKARFIREVQVTRKVTHANVVRTYDVGCEKEKLYFTMEYIEGSTLKDAIKGEPLPIHDATKIMLEISAGLQAIHDLEVIHRDLKSSNVIISNSGAIKISDFGVARPGNSELTGADELLGSATHIAPETWKEGNGSIQTDIYALGVIAYELVTGILPFDGKSAHELMFKHLKLDPVAPVDINPEIPRWLNSLILRMLDKNPQLRPQSASDLIAEINLRLRKSTVEDARKIGLALGAVENDILDQDDPLVDTLEPISQELSPEEVNRSRAKTTEISPIHSFSFTISPATIEESEVKQENATRAEEQEIDAEAAQQKSNRINTFFYFSLRLIAGWAVTISLMSLIGYFCGFELSTKQPVGIRPWSMFGNAAASSALIILLTSFYFTLPLIPFVSIQSNIKQACASFTKYFIAMVAISTCVYLYYFGLLASWTYELSSRELPVIMHSALRAYLGTIVEAGFLQLESVTFRVAQVANRMELLPNGLVTMKYALGYYLVLATIVAFQKVALLPQSLARAMNETRAIIQWLAISFIIALISHYAALPILQIRPQTLSTIIFGITISVEIPTLITWMMTWLSISLVYAFKAYPRK